jgi:hypothetical protein
MRPFTEDVWGLRHMKWLRDLAGSERLTPAERHGMLLARILERCFQDQEIGEQIKESLLRSLQEDPWDWINSEEVRSVGKILRLEPELVLEMWASWGSRLHLNKRFDLPGYKLNESHEELVDPVDSQAGTSDLNGFETSEFTPRSVLADVADHAEMLCRYVGLSCLKTPQAHPVLAIMLAKRYASELMLALEEGESKLRGIYSMPTRSNTRRAFSNDEVGAFYLVHMRERPIQDSEVWGPFTNSSSGVSKGKRRNFAAQRKATLAVSNIKRELGIGLRQYKKRQTKKADHFSKD